MTKEKVVSKPNSKKLKVNGANETCDKTVGLINSKKDDESQEYDLVPPDGGWGWLVLFGSMLVNILIPGTIKSFGVLFVEFLEAFHASPATAAWIPALCYFLYSSLGPISSILSVKFSFRTVTIMGGASAALGMILSFWASSVAYLYLSYGVLVGIGAGLSFPPTVYIVTSYFVKLRGLANGLCISGSALGSIILPPVLRWLLEMYGYRGAILIMGGITLNVFIAAIFYEPVENHLKRVPRKSKKALEDIEEEDIGIVMKFENMDEQPTAPSTAGIIEEEEGDASKHLMPFHSPPGQRHHYDLNGDDNQFVRSASAAVVQSYGKQDEFPHTARTRKISTPVRVPQRNQTFTPGQLNSQSSLYAVPESGRSSHKLERLRNSSRNRLSKRSPSTSSFQYISTAFHGSTLSFQPMEFSSHLSLRSAASGGGGAGGGGGGGGGSSSGAITGGKLDLGSEKDDTRKDDEGSEIRTSTKFFDLSLLKDPMYLIILISNSTNAIGYTNFIILLPAYGVALNFDKSLSAYLISTVSATDLIGRIGGSALSDLEIIPKTWYFVGGLALSGISLAVLPFATSYGMLSFWCAVFGLASGTYIGVTAVIMAAELGPERLTSSYGISLFVNGLLQLVSPPLCGIWFEAIQNYNPLFHTLGIILFAGASLWAFVPFLKRNKTKDNDEDDENYDDEATAAEGMTSKDTV